MGYGTPVKRLATPIFRLAIGQRAALRLAASRNRALVLLYHRVLPDGVAADEIVPSLPRRLFHQHLDALLQLGQIVPLRQLLQPPPAGAPPRFAITFDDDHAGYVDTVLPELQSHGVTATFFLSGRALHGLPPYWWTFVEESLRTRGLDYTRKTLGLTGGTAADLAVALERSPSASELTSQLPHPTQPTMTAAHIRTLSDAGMTIGFHTLHHPILSTLAGHELHAALTMGRDELAVAADRPIDLLAYPHGKATSDVAAAAKGASYVAAFATGGRPITSSSDRFLLHRWEPGPLTGAELRAAIALRLLRAPTRSQSARR
jgi:peptidoglycan/xylan/chitin deacetylase (PgdA/CDA1 family)